jgi:hypothetical protein
MWDAFRWKSGAQMQHLRTFAFSIGKRYQELVPLPDLVSPNKDENVRAYEGWAYCARTKDQEIFLLYFEKDAPAAEVRGLKANSFYHAQWFDPRNGKWMDVEASPLKSDLVGVVQLPHFPTWGWLGVLRPEWISKAPDKLRQKFDESRNFSAMDDWGLKLVYAGPAPTARTW